MEAKDQIDAVEVKWAIGYLRMEYGHLRYWLKRNIEAYLGYQVSKEAYNAGYSAFCNEMM